MSLLLEDDEEFHSSQETLVMGPPASAPPDASSAQAPPPPSELLPPPPPPPHSAGAVEPAASEVDPTSDQTGSKGAKRSWGQGVTSQGVASGQELARNHSKKGKKMSDVKASISYKENQKEQEDLQNAAKLIAQTQETRYRLRQKTQVTQGKEKVKEKTKLATEEAPRARPAAKHRAEYGIAGTFCGRRPPKNKEVAEEFCAIRDAYHAMYGRRLRGRPTNDRNDCQPSQIEYYSEMREVIGDLKNLHPGQPGTWYVEEAQTYKAETKPKANKEGTKEKKAKKAKKITKEAKDEEGVKELKADKDDKDKNKECNGEVDNEHTEGEYFQEEGQEEQRKSDEEDKGEKVKKEDMEIGAAQHVEGMGNIGEEEGKQVEEKEEEEGEEEEVEEEQEQEEEEEAGITATE